MSNNRLTDERISEIQTEAALLHEHVAVAGEALSMWHIKEEKFLNSLTAAECAALSTPFEIDGKRYCIEQVRCTLALINESEIEDQT